MDSNGLPVDAINSGKFTDVASKVEAYLDRYEEEIPHQISGCNSVQDMIDVMPLVSLVTSRYELARIKTGWKDIDVENRLRKLDSVGTDLIEWAATHMNPMSLVMIFFNHGIVSVNTIASTRNVRRVHALALTTGMLEDEWNRSRMIPLYLQSAKSSLEVEHLASVKDFCEAISTVNHLVSLYRQSAAETGWKDRFLEKNLEKMTVIVNDLEDWVASKNPNSLVMIYLKHGIVGSVNTISIPNKVKRVHALALKTGMLEDEWNRSRLMGLYLQASTCTLVDCERLFHGAEKKGLLLFNQMLTVYSRHDPDKAKRLFDELIGTCPPDGATYMGLLHALSVGGEPWEAIKVIQQMESRGVQPDPRHYGVAVDSFARTRTPDFIKAAIDILKYFPSAEHEVTINSILSRCVPPSGVKPVSAKDELELKETMKQAQLDLEEIIKQALVEGLDLGKVIKRALDQGLDLQRTLKQALSELYHPETIKRFQDVLDLTKTIRDAQVVLDLLETIRHAQDLVDYLEKKESKYAVQDKTHWRLARWGLKWPRRVTKN
ncbi:hypothetical protein HID58_071654 [Brassica napus]|uniref:Pentatricopeptide repeat-containing protein n=1 Tax=Brassica napus TaxID=3708 RepID=A0ABQ7Z265_BRANA|nr:hypothetical protein HID58_090609 [Brassica napus]KAH0874282.1 hypothetical protein HID58_071644 [Brassica napus]KAH0874292.1 hypothetical protein HID58_071654 [Brassica napus]